MAVWSDCASEGAVMGFGGCRVGFAVEVIGGEVGGIL